ncbi:MAG: NAD(P)/FAD-dependent oxidoreductase [Rhodospirillales bacterium]|nr:MAG: NAD(P)/FAD-dependent oxidoreductase [Rhodospirillales bacterium]
MNAPADLAVAARQTAVDWLATFERALAAGDAAALAAMFAGEAHWRDVLAFTWRLQTTSGGGAIAAALLPTLGSVKPAGFHLPEGRSSPRRVRRAGIDCVEVVFAFTTASGQANGALRLVRDAGAGPWRAWVLLTTLETLHGHPDPRWHAMGDADALPRDFGGETWLDRRRRARAYDDRDPTVLVVGGGQAGLAIAARLGHLGVDTLIVERNQRIGDNWRRRYRSLTLHNETHVNHMPYMPFPPTWPVFIPKDKLANWLESYAENLELNCWTGTELVRGSYDATAGRWGITLRRDGVERAMRPRHIVFATGVSATPVWPHVPGLDAFAGRVVHSGDYTDGAEWKGRKTIVLGTGTSGHDVAQDLQAAGADVTIVQRSPTYVVSLREAQKVYSMYSEGLPFEDCDLLAAATPYDVLKRSYQLSTAEMRANDAPLLAGLERRGFKLTYGEDDTGFQMMYLRRGGGYYFNVGCSGLIADGKVRLLQYDSIDRFERGGARLKDGTELPAELLVVATGYENQQEMARRHLGEDVAERIGPVWGFDDGGELRNMWRRTAQPGLWFTAGSLAQCRIYSRYLALQIKAVEDGLLPA